MLQKLLEYSTHLILLAACYLWDLEICLLIIYVMFQRKHKNVHLLIEEYYNVEYLE